MIRKWIVRLIKWRIAYLSKKIDKVLIQIVVAEDVKTEQKQRAKKVKLQDALDKWIAKLKKQTDGT